MAVDNQLAEIGGNKRGQRRRQKQTQGIAPDKLCYNKSMEKQFIKGVINKVDKKNGTFEVIASTGDVDRDGEIIEPKGWELKNYLKNPVILWAHNYNALPIGTATHIEGTDKGLIIKGKFASKEANPLAQQVRKLFEEGIQKAVSVGFMPLERSAEDETIITRAELLELSFVPVPANPNALALAMAKGFSAELFDVKVVVANHEPPTANIERSWEADKAIIRLREWAGGLDKDDVDFDKYQTAFGWFDGEDPDKFGSYKLPHCDIVDGKFSVVWRGVITAMATLLGARGGVDIPEKDRKGVYNHLAVHYEQYEKEAPEFRSYNHAELKTLFPEIKIEKDRHGEVCDPSNPKYDPAECARLTREDLPKEVLELLQEKKDIAETVALSEVVAHLSFLADAFEQNDVASNVVSKMRKALAILLDVLKIEAVIGQKEFKTGKQEMPDGTVVQTLILSKERFETREEALNWARDNDFKTDKLDETEDSWRIRQLDPSVCREETFRTIPLTEGVQAVICQPEKGVDNQDTKTYICLLPESESEPEDGKEASDKDGEKSRTKVEEAFVELPIEVVQELRKATLPAYKQNELILAITKRVLAQNQK